MTTDAAQPTWRDPVRHEWTGGDVAVGWLFGAAAVAAQSLAFGILAIAAGGGVGMLTFVLGILMLSLYGIPVAIAAATALRPVRWEWLHLLVFAALGALGGALALVALTWTWHPVETLALPAAFGAITAVTARGFARRSAIRSRGERPRIAEEVAA